MTAEPRSLLIDRVNDHSPCPVLAASAHAAAQRIDKQVPAKRVALLDAVDRQTREQHNRDWVGHPTTQPRRSTRVLNGRHRQRAVSDHPIAPAQHVNGRGGGRGGRARRLLEPTIKRRGATTELLEAVMIGDKQSLRRGSA